MEKWEGGRDESGRVDREKGRDRGWRRGREGEMGVGGKVERKGRDRGWRRGREGEMGVGGKVGRKEGIGGGEEGGRERWEWEGR